MVIRTFLLGIILFTLIGCLTTLEVVDSRQGPSLAKAHEIIQEESVTVMLRDSSMYEGHVVPSGQDSLAVIVGSHNERRCVTLKDVRTIRFASSGFGYIAGGAVLGGAIGAGVGVAVYESASSGNSYDMSGLAGLLGGGVGLLLGGIGGGLITPTTEFLIIDSPNELVTIKLKPDESLWPQLTADQDVSGLELWRGSKRRTLSGNPIQVRFKGRSIFVTATKADFLRAGIPVE